MHVALQAQRVKGTNAVGHRDESRPEKKEKEEKKERKKMKSRTKRSSCKINEPAGVPSASRMKVTRPLNTFPARSVCMNRYIYPTTRSCGEPLLNRAAFSFRSPFTGRNLRSLKRRHGTTRADLYTARLSSTIILFSLPLSSLFLTPLSLCLSFLSLHFARYRVTRLDLWQYFESENIQPVSFRDVKAKRLSYICTYFSPSRPGCQ